MPAELNRLRGNRGLRTPKKVQPVNNNPHLIDRPLNMSQPVAVWWDAIVREALHLETLRISDSVAVMLLADALESYHRLNLEFRDNEVLQDTKGKCYTNPRFTVLKGQRISILRLLSELGMTPSARTRLLNPTSDQSPPPTDSPREKLNRYLTV